MIVYRGQPKNHLDLQQKVSGIHTHRNREGHAFHGATVCCHLVYIFQLGSFYCGLGIFAGLRGCPQV